jgi:membrane-associated phospholipid phosphatase
MKGRTPGCALLLAAFLAGSHSARAQQGSVPPSASADIAAQKDSAPRAPEGAGAKVDGPKISGSKVSGSKVNGTSVAPKKTDGSNTASNNNGYQLLPGEDPENRLGLPFLKHLAMDQKNFWVVPAHLKVEDLRWIVPLASGTAALIATDSWVSQQVPDSPSQLDRSKKISEYTTYSMIGLDGASFLFGHLTGNDHLSETGLLGGEAAIDATAAAYVFKAITQRPRPYQGNQHGSFFQGGYSFPSEHSAVAWSLASTWAHEYPGTLSQILAYGLASAVTLTRVTARQHFPSDVVIGSALGWYFGREVYRAHHDPELGGAPWGPLLPEHTAERPRNPANMGSPYVPLDSWVYPLFERLAALGYIQTGYLDMRPWTRLECARLVEEAEDKVSQDPDEPAAKMVAELSLEFAPESRLRDGAPNRGAALGSIYARVTDISGPPLRDSFHFSQTLVNDYGRPYAEGVNTILGGSAYAEAGPFFSQIRAEYQQAPASPSYPLQTLEAIEQVDRIPSFQNPTAAVSRPTLLESMAGFQFHNVEFSFGKETAWLGPARSGSLLMSNNSTPMPMVRIDSTEPYNVPGLSRLLGPAKSEFFVGQLSGQTYVYNGTQTLGPRLTVQPFIHDDRISFQPTPNLQFGMGISVMFGGQSLPFTWANFLRTYYAHSPNTSVNPGKRFSGFDFTYRIPGLRNWLTFYLDSMVVDEVSPIGSTRPSLNPGIYLPQLPKLSRLEFRIEGLKTDQAPHVDFPPGYVYTDRRYLSGYTNDGLVIGNWIGRAGIGGQAWATYHLTTRDSLEFSYRHAEVDHSFLQGGRLNDFSAQGDFKLGRGTSFSAFLQYEQWAFPALNPLPQSNLTASFQFTFWPKRLKLASGVARP